jgi:ABC-type branched-subunit amino acid transport system substrate-binding protein
VKELIESNQVVGIFGLSLSSTHAPALEQAQAAKVPLVASFSGVKPALPPAQPYYYSTGVVFEVAGEASAQYLKTIAQPGAKIVGTTFESVGGRAAVRHEQFVAEKLGFKYETVIFPVATRDFAPVAQSIAGKKPDVVVGHFGSEQNLGMIPALRNAGYNGSYVVANYGVTEPTVRTAASLSPKGENIYFVSRYVSVHEDLPEVKNVQAAARKYGISKEFAVNHLLGWALGKTMEAALKSCKWPCSSTQLDKTLSDLTVETAGLTGGPIKFTSSDHYGPTQWALYKYDAATKKMVRQGAWLPIDKLAAPV